MSRAVAQRANRDGFVKPGELVDIRAGAELSLQDRRVFNLLIEHAWPEIAEDKPHKIALFRLRGPRHKGAERVADSIKTLMTTLVEVPTRLDGEPAVFATQLLGETTRMIDEDRPNAMLVYSFPKGLRRIIVDSHHWGRIKAYVMFAFSSKYALALYEAVCLRGNLRANEQIITVETLRDLIGVERGKLEQPFNLKKWAIDPAVAEVNALSDFNVEIEPIRQGGLVRGRLTGFRLTWERKTREEWAAVLDELSRPKLGRRARIRGTVEQIVG
jgi:hypothetical protein